MGVGNVVADVVVGGDGDGEDVGSDAGGLSGGSSSSSVVAGDSGVGLDLLGVDGRADADEVGGV